jgi:hypothetical protein
MMPRHFLMGVCTLRAALRQAQRADGALHANSHGPHAAAEAAEGVHPLWRHQPGQAVQPVLS